MEVQLELGKSTTTKTGPPWYVRWLAYLKNHGRVDPGKVELPHCDFFIVSQRRTLRVLRPPMGGRWFYDTNNDRPESLNDNFFSRWSKRPHPSGNCRCSFRQSARLSTTEEQIIFAQINRIRNSLCEAERTGQDIEEIERKLSINLDTLTPMTQEPRSDGLTLGGRTDRPIDEGTQEKSPDEKVAKNKIVRDLERYINDLLEEIVTDSVKIVTDNERSNGERLLLDAGTTRVEGSDGSVTENARANAVELREEESREKLDEFANINFAFHARDTSASRNSSERDEAAGEKGYSNPAFLGSTNDPDALEFYLNRPIGKNTSHCHLSEQMDCVDSGINSVETVEFQPDLEPSLEESLMEIIDAKLGRTRLRKSWEDFQNPDTTVENDEEAAEDGSGLQTSAETVASLKEGAKASKEFAEDEREHHGKTESNKDDTKTSPVIAESEELDERSTETSFDKLRLEFNEISSADGVQLRRKRPTAAELLEGDEEISETRRSSDELKDSCSSVHADGPRDSILSRQNRKPTIVFLHGFGSSADVFELQLRYFSSLGYPCIAPDLLGHGLSSAPDRSCDYHFDKLLKDLDVVLHHYAFRPGQKCVIVAHNYGCSFAAALAAKYEANVHQLVLISGGGPTPLARPSAEGAAHCCLRAMVAPLLVCGIRREVMYAPRGRQHPYCGSESPDLRPSHMRYVLDGMDWPEGEYTFYRRICIPTLLVHGLRDKDVSLVQECQMERTMIKAFLEALPSAGHNPMSDCPDQLNHMIHCFIDLWKNKKW